MTHKKTEQTPARQAPASGADRLVTVGNREGVGILTINRPDAHNALNLAVQQALREALDAVADDDDIDVVVITGAGGKSFVAGADINELAVRTPVEGIQGKLQGLFDRIEGFDKPVIAAIGGFAFGGGAELALSCDIRVGSTNAQIALPETGLGIIPSAGATQRLANIVGQGLALDMILTGKRLSAQEAYDRDILTYLVEPEELLDTAVKVAQRIQLKGPLAIKLGRQVIKRGFKADPETGLMLERLAQAVIYSHAEKAEGTKAFQEKRHPDFGSIRHDR